MSAFWQEYQKPQWQQKRLQIMEAANFECSDCGANDKKLNVHHSYYEPRRKPWDYPEESLHCLCDDCHKKYEELRVNLRREIGLLGPIAQSEIFGYALGLHLLCQSKFEVERKLLNYEVCEGIGRAWGLQAEDVIAILMDEEGDLRCQSLHAMCEKLGVRHR